MPDTTPGGLPIPLDSDPLAQVAAWVRDLAAAVESSRRRSAAGVENDLPVSATGTVYSREISFPAGRFTTAPAVTVTVNTNSPTSAAAAASNITATGFRLFYNRNSGTANMTVSWSATQTG